MAGTVTVNYKRHDSMKMAVIDWLSSAGGAADGSFNMDGTIERITTNPDANAPTALYDIALTDADGIDLAQTLLANRDATNSESVVPLINTSKVAYAGVVTVAVTNAGNAKQGRITVYYR